jgi:hypothetical protein
MSLLRALCENLCDLCGKNPVLTAKKTKFRAKDAKKYIHFV